jgi:hypothetical protein
VALQVLHISYSTYSTYNIQYHHLHIILAH